ncbi:EamA family transporter [Candidatus Bathyarchaeota archaeon]|nr:EamA family transporter [Candidatus Bathyarchaeota archaeon]
MDWFILAVLDAFFAALVAIFAKVGLQGVDSNVATALRAIVMTVFLIGFVVAMDKGSQLTQLTSKDMIFIVLSGVAGAISWLLYFAALKMADASKVAPVDRASLLFVLLLSVLLLGEQITLKTAIAGTLIFIGVLLLAI